MKICSIETCDGSLEQWDQRLILRQRFSQRGRRLRALVLSTAGVAILVPFGAVAMTGGALDQAAKILAHNPMALPQLGLLFAIGLFATVRGILDFIRPGLKSRNVTIDANTANVEEFIGGRRRRWQEPVNAYRGLRHRVFTTSSGAMHALILEHEDTARSVHLKCGAPISDQAISAAASCLGLPVLAATAHDSGRAQAHRTGMWLARLIGSPRSDAGVAST